MHVIIMSIHKKIHLGRNTMKKINDEYIMVDDIDNIVRSWKSYVSMPNP